MYVGDTLTLTITIPDSSFKVSEYPPFDTTWYKIESFENSSFGYSFLRIDTTQLGGIDRTNPYGEAIYTIGNIDMPYVNVYPFKHQTKEVLKMPGIYFFQSAYDEIPKINGIYGSMIIEWDVSYKNFELLKGKEKFCQNCSIDALKYADEIDANNYFPFEVIER